MVRLHAESEQDYYIAQANVGMTFQLDRQGRSTALILHIHLSSEQRHDVQKAETRQCV